VTTALQEYIEHHKQKLILQDFGTVDYDPAYDYKARTQQEAHVMVLVDTPVVSFFTPQGDRFVSRGQAHNTKLI
jgi:hypothetical protein